MLKKSLGIEKIEVRSSGLGPRDRVYSYPYSCHVFFSWFFPFLTSGKDGSIRDGPLEKWWGWGWGKTKQKTHAREGDWKKIRAKKKWRKNNFCRVNCTVGFTNCTRLKGTLAATSYCSFNFLDLVFYTVRKTGIFSFQGRYILWAATSSWTLVAKLPLQKTLMDKQPSCLIRLHF